jgi:hypothetical protein
MELVSLDIERFGCIGRARIAFKPGLNVLYGANEIGKSSIARAIRFAFLLPSSSSVVEPWVPWRGGGDPTVTIVFKKDSTEYYRIKKAFGTTTASLERSSSDTGWTNIARAREVDGRLRALLQWGVPEPGGAKATKGLPESFLARTLLAEQDDVAGIFQQDLESDGVDSGRARVRAALQAMAQDPLFKSVLAAAQARVDEAFTPTGQRKRGARDPFKMMADDVTARQRERDEAERDATASQANAQTVAKLQREVALAESDSQEKTLWRQSLEQRRVRQDTLDGAIAALKAGQAAVDALAEAEKKVRAAEEVLRDLESRIPGLRAIEDEARKAFEAATTNASLASETRRAELAELEAANLRERQALRERKTRVDVALDLRKAIDLNRQGNETENSLKHLDKEIAALEAIEAWSELRAAKAALHEVNQRERKAADLLTKANCLRSEAAAEWPTERSHRLPDAKRLAELRNLHHKLDMAETKLDVGLSVDVRGAATALASVDGGAKEVKASPFEIEAKKSAQLQLNDGIEIWVRGGRSTDRAEAEQVRRDWHAATVTLFTAVDVADFTALEDAYRSDVEKKARATTFTQEAAQAEAERRAIGDLGPEKQRLSARILELERRLEGADLDLIEATAAAHGLKTHDVMTLRTNQRESCRSELANIRAQEAVLRQRAATDTNLEVIADLEAEVHALSQAEQELAEREESIVKERKALDATPSTNAVLQEQHTNAKNALDDANKKIEVARSERGSWSARMEERRAAAASVDIETLTRAEGSLRAAASNDGTGVDDSAIDTARNAEEAAKSQREARVGALREAEGALQASGGAAAEERLHELEAALKRAHEKQATLEDEYEAWKLLTESLKEAERSQATHLGNLLAPDLAARLQALAGQRYSGIALSPHLRLEGIEAAGERRELERLSVGTREQLSTLFRLCLAERLRSAVVLDDQLVQSDTDRLRWFRRALRQTASTGVQLIVLTCRPDDYLEPAEIPPPNVVDLSSVISGQDSDDNVR